MKTTTSVRVRTNVLRDFKVCSGEVACSRPVLPTYGLCSTHLGRRRNKGTTLAEHPLFPRQRTPYIQASLVYCKTLIRRAQSSNPKKTRRPCKEAALLLQTLTELDTFIRNHCEKVRFTDLNKRRHLNSKRKAQALLHATLARWPQGTLAALAVFCSILGTRLCCAVEGPSLPSSHREAFRRAMQVKAVAHLIQRKRPPFMAVKEFRTSRPRLAGRWIAKRLDDYLEPFIRFSTTDSKARDKAILELVAGHVYLQDVRWETLRNKTLTLAWRRPGHPCKWKGKPAPTKEDT